MNFTLDNLLAALQDSSDPIAREAVAAYRAAQDQKLAHAMTCADAALSAADANEAAGFWRNAKQLVTALAELPVTAERRPLFEQAERLAVGMMDAMATRSVRLVSANVTTLIGNVHDVLSDQAAPPTPTRLMPLETVAQLEALRPRMSDAQICRTLCLTRDQLAAERAEPGSVMNNPDSGWCDPRQTKAPEKPFPLLVALGSLVLNLRRAPEPEPQNTDLVPGAELNRSLIEDGQAVAAALDE